MDVRGKRVLVVGLARSGRAAALCLSRRGAVVTVIDRKPPSAFQEIVPELVAQKIGLELGVQRAETFLQHDVIVVSPGVPLDLPELQAARERGIPVFPEVEVASWFLQDQRLLGVTGTNGKSTTTALLGRMLEASGFPTFVGGNIGVPLISAVDQLPAESLIVAELSSYQLEAIQEFHPHVAVLLNITSHHMDRHRTFEDYARAKAQIFRNQGPDDCAVLNVDDPAVMGLAPGIKSRRIFFGKQNLPNGVFLCGDQIFYRVNHLERGLLRTRDVRLRGDFNLENVMAAAAAACAIGADFEAIRHAVRDFKGLPHRLEFVREVRGVDFYNDSKATSIDAACKALSAFDGGVHLILGGKDEGIPSGALGPWLKNRARDVYLIGETAERFARELSGAAELVAAGDLETAMRKGFSRALPGEVLLLAPACPSFDQFQDFEHRGRVFREIAERLAQEAPKPGPGVQSSGFGGRDAGSAARGSGLKAASAGLEADPSGSVAEVQDSSFKPEESSPEATSFAAGSSPVSQEAAPNAEPQRPNLELLHVYEVAAEEAAPLEMESLTTWRDEFLEARSLRQTEECQDEVLPFEVRAARAAGESMTGPRSEKQRGEAAPPLKSKQTRLPGM